MLERHIWTETKGSHTQTPKNKAGRNAQACTLGQLNHLTKGAKTKGVNSWAQDTAVNLQPERDTLLLTAMYLFWIERTEGGYTNEGHLRQTP